MNASSAWLAGSTIRWHVQPSLARTGDRVDGHSARVSILILTFMPEAPLELLRAAVIHDLGESQVGDIAYPVKLAHPEITAATEILERVALRKMGLDYPDLDEELETVLRFCDRVDAYLWALHHTPVLVLSNEKWVTYFRKLLAQAESLGWDAKFIEIVDGVRDGVF